MCYTFTGSLLLQIMQSVEHGLHTKFQAWKLDHKEPAELSNVINSFVSSLYKNQDLCNVNKQLIFAFYLK